MHIVGIGIRFLFLKQWHIIFSLEATLIIRLRYLQSDVCLCQVIPLYHSDLVFIDGILKYTQIINTHRFSFKSMNMEILLIFNILYFCMTNVSIHDITNSPRHNNHKPAPIYQWMKQKNKI